MTLWRSKALILSAVGVVCACSGNDDGGGPAAPRSPIELAPDTASADITWNPKTAVIGADAIAASLQNRYAEDGVYRFDGSAEELRGLSVGDVVVLTGVDLVRIKGVDVADDVITLTTEPATLADAASDAEVSWDVGVDLSKPVQLNDGSGMLRPLANPEILCTPPVESAACKDSFSGTLGNLKTTQKLQTLADGTLKMSVSMEYPQQGNAVLKAALNANVRSFRHEGAFVIHGGSLESAYLSLRDVEIDVDVDAGAVAIGGGENFFKLPLKLTFPFELGPIPAYATVSATITLTPALSAQSSLRSHVKFHVHGSAGFKIEGTTITSSGSFQDVDNQAPSASDVSYVSTVNAGLGVLFEGPRVGLGIGLVDKASIEGYVTPKFEVVMNQALKTDGLGIIASSCTTVRANVGAYAGGSFRLGGIKLGKEVQLFGVTHDVYRDGRAHGEAYPAACQ